MGLLLYGSLRLAEGIFYGRLGFTPEEVGLGYAETVAGAIFGALVWAAIPLGVALLAVGAKLRAKSRDAAPPSRGEVRAAVVESRAMNFVSVLLIFSFVAVPILYAIAYSERAAAGVPASSSVFAFPLRARAAIVHVDESSMSKLHDGVCVLYLGQSDGVMALYDPATRTSWRASASTVAIETGGPLGDVEQVPEDCPS